MTKRLILASACYLLAALLAGSFGLIYVVRPQFMPYHAAAVGRDWTALEPSFQILVLALMKVAGGGWLAAATAIIILLGGPFRRGESWARLAIPAVGLLVSVSSLYATLLVRRNTPASPPWLFAAGATALLLAGLGLSLAVPKAGGPIHRGPSGTL